MDGGGTGKGVEIGGNGTTKRLLTFSLALLLAGCVTPTPGPTPDPTPTPTPAPITHVEIPHGVLVGCSLLTYGMEQDPVATADLFARNNLNAMYLEWSNESTEGRRGAAFLKYQFNREQTKAMIPGLLRTSQELKAAPWTEERARTVLASIIKANKARGITTVVCIGNASGGGLFQMFGEDWFQARWRWLDANYPHDPMVIQSPLAEWTGSPGDGWVFNWLIMSSAGLSGEGMINGSGRPDMMQLNQAYIDYHPHALNEFGPDVPEHWRCFCNTDGPVLGAIGEPADPVILEAQVEAALRAGYSYCYSAYNLKAFDVRAVEVVGRAVRKVYGRP